VNTTGCPGDFIQFNDSSSNATSWSWTFNGGFPSTSALQNPIVSFTPGTHSVTLTASGPGGTDSFTRTNYITIDSRPVASLSTNDTLLTLPGAIATFVNSSTNATSYEWSFGDGTSSSSASPSHMYTVAGTYTVTLVAINGACANDTMIYSTPIVVQAPNGIQSYGAQGASIYPNPFMGSFDITLDINETSQLSINMKDVLGKMVCIVKEQTVDAGKKTYHVDPSAYELAKGVYFIEIKDNNSTRYLRAISY
jgi:PKD repeat protein